ncbi:MAG TPA: two-component sensor histidine kinase, partial [Lachnospiraceae bacterium]|nr:two-component sensor histidine kinase [Lachnospiraceae bacterium]
MEAAASQIRQLTSLLVDNAIKYCDDKGEVKVRVYAVRKGIQLQVSNPYADGKNVDYSRFFERFYREDQSHHADSEKGG